MLPDPAGPAASTLATPLPKKFTVVDLGDQLTITWRWFNLQTIALTVFSVFWNGFLVTWCSIAISQRLWFMLAFATLHIAVGVFLTYYVVAGYINTTTIHVNLNEFSVKHGPMRWPGNHQLDPVDVTQLFCRQQIHRGKHGVTYSYDVCARLRDGRDLRLIRKLSTPEHALALEKHLEQWLGIEDQSAAHPEKC